MTKRYYICRRVLTGGDIIIPELRVYLSAIHPTAPNYLFQVFGHYLAWCLLAYDLNTPTHNDVMANIPQIFDFPATALDNKLDTINPAKRTAIQNKLTNIGFSFGWVNINNNSVRDVIEYLAHSIQLSKVAEIPISAQNFDMDTTVAQIPVPKKTKIQNWLVVNGIPTGWITNATTVREVVSKIQRNDDNSPRLARNGIMRFFHDAGT